MKHTILLSLTILILTATAFGQSKQTAHTLKLDEGKTGEKVTIQDMKWLSGTWNGTGLGGTVEEIYSAPQDGVMNGMFRFFSKGKTVFYEWITVAETNGTLIIRLKHFNADMTGWEDKNKTVDFKFVKREKNRYYFEGQTLEVVDKSSFNIYLAIKHKDGTVSEEIFRYKRIK